MHRLFFEKTIDNLFFCDILFLTKIIPEFTEEFDMTEIKNGYDIVIVARHAAEHAPFEALMEEMTSLLRQLGAAENKPEVLADA